MRVLHLTTHLNVGGITTYILRLVRPLKKLGIETFVLSSGGTCIPEFEERNARVFTLPIRTKNELNPKLYLNLPALKKIVLENKIDLVHAHTRVTQIMAYWLQKSTGIPFITTCHGYYKRRLGRRLIPAWGERVIAISEGVADHLSNDFKVPTAKIKTIHNGVDLEEMGEAFARHSAKNVKTVYGFQAENPVVGIIARLVADKGHEYLVRSISLLTSQFPNIRFLIVGDGPNRSFLEKLVKELHHESRVVFTGNVQDVTHPLAAMDIFTLPATWREGFGLSIVEAMACRKPVIVSNIWSLNTLIQDGITGILIPPKATEPLAAAISNLLKNPVQRQKIAEEGSAMVEKLFSISRMASEIRDTYEEIAAVKHLP